jgi:hypothetical protein
MQAVAGLDALLTDDMLDAMFYTSVNAAMEGHPVAGPLSMARGVPLHDDHSKWLNMHRQSVDMWASTFTPLNCVHVAIWLHWAPVFSVLILVVPYRNGRLKMEWSCACRVVGSITHSFLSKTTSTAHAQAPSFVYGVQVSGQH